MPSDIDECLSLSVSSQALSRERILVAQKNSPAVRRYINDVLVRKKLCFVLLFSSFHLKVISISKSTHLVHPEVDEIVLILGDKTVFLINEPIT